MDIHAPMEPIHSWRDIALHLGIITIGLFIALSLEGLVQYVHDVHLVHEARANIRQELQIDDTATKKDISRIQQNIDTLKADIATIHRMQANVKGAKYSLNNTMSFDTLDDAAWRTARDTGALSFMPYSEVQRYSDLYMLEGLVNQKAIDAGEKSYQAEASMLMGYDLDKLPPDEFTRMLHANASTEIDLLTLKQYLVQLDQQFQAELKK